MQTKSLRSLFLVTAGASVLTPLGELWVEPVGDGKSEEFRRVRVVTATTWIKRGELVPMAWANATAADASAHKQWALRAEAFVLGPRARRELLNKSGKDEALLAWIDTTYGAQGVVNAARGSMRKHKGLSGFLKRTEHELDHFGAGHAGTAISAALGFAAAR